MYLPYFDVKNDKANQIIVSRKFLLSHLILPISPSFTVISPHYLFIILEHSILLIHYIRF